MGSSNRGKRENLPNVMVKKVTLRKGDQTSTSTFANPTPLADAVRLARIDIKMFNPKESPQRWKYVTHSTT
jgi:hypothetical protein